MATATDPKPTLRHPADLLTGRTSMLRRVVPACMLYAQIRKFYRLPG